MYPSFDKVITIVYTPHIKVRMTHEFASWLRRLRDKRASDRIVKRIRRIELGNLGDTKPVGGGVHEFRIDYGQGYRVYFANAQSEIVILLVGGNKSTQNRDIREAKRLLSEYTD